MPVKQIVIIENPSEIGAGTRGASLGIDSLRIAAISKKLGVFHDHSSKIIQSENDRLFESVEFAFAKRIEGVSLIYDRVCACVRASLWDEEFPIILSGDHSSAGGSIAGVKTSAPDKRLGIVWIDAHADLHSPYTTPSGNVHGMPVATAMAFDNKDCMVNEPDAGSAMCWELLKNIGGISPKVLPSDAVFIGVRSTEAPEDHLMKKHEMRNFMVDEIRSKGVDAVLDQTKEILSDCDSVYITFDVDSLDTSISVGTGTPVPNGLLLDEAEALLRGFASWDKVTAMEFCEVNPLLDTTNKMAMAAVGLLNATVDQLKKRFEL